MKRLMCLALLMTLVLSAGCAGGIRRVRPNGTAVYSNGIFTDTHMIVIRNTDEVPVEIMINGVPEATLYPGRIYSTRVDVPKFSQYRSAEYLVTAIGTVNGKMYHFSQKVYVYTSYNSESRVHDVPVRLSRY